MAVGDCGERGQGARRFGRFIRYDNQPWEPGYLITGFRRPFLVSHKNVKKQNYPDYPDGMSDAVIETDRIIFTLLGNVK